MGRRESYSLLFLLDNGWWAQITAAAAPGRKASWAPFVPAQDTEAFSRNEIYILLTQNPLHLFAIRGKVHGEPIRYPPPSAPGSRLCRRVFGKWQASFS